VSSFLDQEIPREPEVIELFKTLIGAVRFAPLRSAVKMMISRKRKKYFIL
jgi:hypothetical protein